MSAGAADRIRGFLWGAAVGDALGAGVNDLSTDRIRERFGPRMLGDFVEERGAVGAASQHTQLLMFCCESLIRAFVRADAKGIGPPFASMLDHAYARWLETQGTTSPRWDSSEFDGWLRTEPGLWNERRGRSKVLEGLQAAKAGSIEDSINDSRGCGALPVVSAAGLLTALERSQRHALAEELAAVTHGHRDAQIAAGAVAELVDRTRSGTPLLVAAGEVEQRLYDSPGADAVRDAVGQAIRLSQSHSAATPEVVEGLGKGWTAPEALAISLYCALTARNFEEGVLAAVNHGGDSDACGALCGQLLGTVLGARAIPGHWRSRLELKRPVAAMADDLAAWYAQPERRPSLDEDQPWVWARYPGW